MLTLSKGIGIEGTFEKNPDTFVVKEIAENGTMMQQDRRYSAEELGLAENHDGKFAVFVLQKRNWNTIQALEAVSRKAGHGIKAIGYAGIKDRRALTVQLASIFGASPEGIAGMKLRDLSINGAWPSETGVEAGSLLGNAFDVTIATSDTDAKEKADSIYAELDGLIPNYFDRQRFGSRLNNAVIGLHIMKGDFHSAVMEFLTSCKNETNSSAIEARKRLAEEQDFEKAMGYFPSYLKYERRLIAYLSKYKDNFANAIRKMPRGISIMFVNAVEDVIFNAIAEDRVKSGGINADTPLVCEENFYGFPDMERIVRRADAGTEGKRLFAVGNLIGYESNADEISEPERRIMESLGITKDSFKIASMPELSMRGSRRPLFVPAKGFSAENAASSVKVSFSLPSGSYATIMLNELMKTDKLGIEELMPSLDG